VLERRLTKFREITQSNGHYEFTLFKVILGHRVWYRSKAHMGRPISD